MRYMLNKMDKEQQKEHLITIMNEDAKNGLYNKPTKQTAVEWLANEIESHTHHTIRIPREIIEQAKAMHKEEITEAHLAGQNSNEDIENGQTEIEYYDENYGGEE